jgi:hypothetical protein
LGAREALNSGYQGVRGGRQLGNEALREAYNQFDVRTEAERRRIYLRI